MKNKSVLTLIELSIMLLVFFLSAALCFNIFLRSDEISRESEARDRAVVLSQNAAELLKNSRGDIALVTEILGESAKEDALTLNITPIDSGSRYLGKARVTVSFDGDTVFSLDVAWQEAREDE